MNLRDGPGFLRVHRIPAAAGRASNDADLAIAENRV
jgi:hypothetical protein